MKHAKPKELHPMDARSEFAAEPPPAMDARSYFAGKAMEAFLISYPLAPLDTDELRERMGKHCWDAADALLATRDGKGGSEGS